jgi:hypothetical protein
MVKLLDTRAHPIGHDFDIHIVVLLSGRHAPARFSTASDLARPCLGVHQLPGEMVPLFLIFSVLFSHFSASPKSDGGDVFLSECTSAAMDASWASRSHTLSASPSRSSVPGSPASLRPSSPTRSSGPLQSRQGRALH